MSATLPQADIGTDSTSVEVHSLSDGRCDGSRTSPDIQYEIMRRHKADMTVTAIARDVGCDPRTVKAVIQNWGTSAHTLRLQAHRPQVVDALILGMHSAAEKGKLDSLLSLSDRLGITEPVRNANQTSVGVQVILNGGSVPLELSRAKVTETSEGPQNQAGTEACLISPVMDAVATSPQVIQAQSVTADSTTPGYQVPVSVPGQDAQATQAATFVAESEKQA